MQNSLKGKILRGVGGLYTVRILPEDGEQPYTVRVPARGSFRHEKLSPLPGDTVELCASDVCAEGDAGLVIDKLSERRNCLIRPPMANLDFLFVTMSAASPSPVLPTVDKMICIAEHNRIEPVIIITKRELDEQEAERLYSVYHGSGFNCFYLSAAMDIGVTPLEEFIKTELSGKTAAFAGASGIGKSTLLNRLFPDLQLATSEISRKIERGRHTTREVTLFPMSEQGDCGYIADTPGFSMLDFKRFDFFEKDDLVDTMRDFAPYIGSCRYTKCSHTKEEGCAVLEALRRGEIAQSRHQSYVELYDILKTRKKWD